MNAEELSRLSIEQRAAYNTNLAFLEVLKALAAESKSPRVMRALAYTEAICHKTPAQAAGTMLQAFE